MSTMYRPHRTSPPNGRVFMDVSCDPSPSSTVSKVCQQTTFPISYLHCRSLQKVDMLLQFGMKRSDPDHNISDLGSQVRGSQILCVTANYCDCDSSLFYSIPPPPQANARKVPQIRPWPHPSGSFPIYYSPLSNNFTLDGLSFLKAFSNKLQVSPNKSTSCIS
jgi:hypothetical protein